MNFHRQNVCPFTQLLYLEPTEINSKKQNQKITKTRALHHAKNNKDYLLNSKQWGSNEKATLEINSRCLPDSKVWYIRLEVREGNEPGPGHLGTRWTLAILVSQVFWQWLLGWRRNTWLWLSSFLFSPNFLNKDGKLGLITFATVCQFDWQGKIPLIMADRPEDADDWRNNHQHIKTKSKAKENICGTTPLPGLVFPELSSCLGSEKWIQTPRPPAAAW